MFDPFTAKVVFGFFPEQKLRLQPFMSINKTLKDKFHKPKPETLN
jgi:hypothetical protein